MRCGAAFMTDSTASGSVPYLNLAQRAAVYRSGTPWWVRAPVDVIAVLPWPALLNFHHGHAVAAALPPSVLTLVILAVTQTRGNTPDAEPHQRRAVTTAVLTGRSSGDALIDAWARDVLQQRTVRRGAATANRVITAVVCLLLMTGPVVAGALRSPWWLLCAIPAVALVTAVAGYVTVDELANLTALDGTTEDPR